MKRPVFVPERWHEPTDLPDQVKVKQRRPGLTLVLLVVKRAVRLVAERHFDMSAHKQILMTISSLESRH